MDKILLQAKRVVVEFESGHVADLSPKDMESRMNMHGNADGPAFFEVNVTFPVDVVKAKRHQPPARQEQKPL